MGDMIAGPGQGLPKPQALYPALLWTTPFTAPTNRVMLTAGQALLVPAGTWIIEGGDVSRVQWLDPVSGLWNNLVRSPAITDPTRHWGTTLRSDGFNFRVANLSGVAVGAEVANGGSNYVRATTHAVASQGNSRWRVVVGGSLGAITIVDPGKNYSIPPIVFVPAPPHPGICATGHATLDSDGRVQTVVWDNVGAGYPFAPPVLLIPDPFDPNLIAFAEEVPHVMAHERIENAKATTVLAGHGEVTAILMEHFGEPLSAPPTLTISGSGTGAAATLIPSAWVFPQDDEITMQPASGP